MNSTENAVASSVGVTGGVEDRGRGHKPRVLAVWASLAMADELAGLRNRDYRTLREFEFDVISATALQSPGGKMLERDYFALLLAFSERDTLHPEVAEWICGWADANAQNGTRPLVICRFASFEHGNGSSAPSTPWHQLIEEIRERSDVDVLWDECLL